MSKHASFTIELDSELHDAFMEAAESARRPASQVVRDLMREFVERQHDPAAYDDFLAHKVATARASARAGRVRSNEDVEAEFTARRALASNSDKS